MLKLRSGKELRVTKQKKKKKTFEPKRIKHKETQLLRGILRRRKWFRNLKGRQNSARRTGSLSTNEKKLLELKYTKGPGAYRSKKNLQKSTKLKPSNVKLSTQSIKIIAKDFLH